MDCSVLGSVWFNSLFIKKQNTMVRDTMYVLYGQLEGSTYTSPLYYDCIMTVLWCVQSSVAMGLSTAMWIKFTSLKILHQGVQGGTPNNKSKRKQRKLVNLTLWLMFSQAEYKYHRTTHIPQNHTLYLHSWHKIFQQNYVQPS